MIAEALDTMWTLTRAFAAWIIIGSLVASITLLTAVATGTWATRALWRAVSGPSWARGRIRARIHAHTRTRRPSARTADPDYEEAA